MSAAKVEGATHVDAPIEAVFAAAFGYIYEAATGTPRPEGEPRRSGAQRATGGVVRTTRHWELVTYEPPRHFRFSYRNTQRFRATDEFWLEPAGEGTMVRYAGTIEPPLLLRPLFGRIGPRMIEGYADRQFDRVREALGLTEPA